MIAANSFVEFALLVGFLEWDSGAPFIFMKGLSSMRSKTRPLKRGSPKDL